LSPASGLGLGMLREPVDEQDMPLRTPSGGSRAGLPPDEAGPAAAGSKRSRYGEFTQDVAQSPGFT
jgi:hypothetical protein